MYHDVLFFFKQKTAYEMRISDWSSDVCSSDLEVTGRIISELEAGRLPWVQPWGSTGSAGPGLPRNALTARNYSGVNVLILWGAVIEHGWPSQSWLTFRQAQEAGGGVRKGERGVTAVSADRFPTQAGKKRRSRGGCDPKD